MSGRLIFLPNLLKISSSWFVSASRLTKAAQTSNAADIILAFLLRAAPTALKFLSRISA